MDIEVKLALQVVRPELAEMRFVPGDNGRKTDLPKTGEEGECGEDDGCEDGLPVVDDIYNALSLEDVRQSMHGQSGGALLTCCFFLSSMMGCCWTAPFCAGAPALLLNSAASRSAPVANP